MPSEAVCQAERVVNQSSPVFGWLVLDEGLACAVCDRAWLKSSPIPFS